MDKMTYDYIIIGAGPAGLQLGYYFQKAGLNYVILEATETAGAFFRDFPRHRMLISINKVHTGYDDPNINLRWDWNSLLSDGDEDPLLFKSFSQKYFPDANVMVEYLSEYARRQNLNIEFNSRVSRIDKADRFEIECESGAKHSAKVVVVATGTPLPQVADIPGIEHVECYTTVSVDPNDFAGQRVLILGKGNSAFETADNLIGTTSLIHVASPETVKMAWQSHYVGHLRAVNNNFLDTYQLKSQNAALDATISYILKDGDKYHVGINYSNLDEEEEIVYDRVIACTGFRFDPSYFGESCRPELTIDNRFPRQSAIWESTNVPDLYFAGSIMQSRDFKKTQSAFVHGFRYNVRLLSRLLQQKYEDVPLMPTTFDVCPMELARRTLHRVNTNSGLWQQNGFLCDVIAIDNDRSSARYFEELSCDYVREIWARDESDYFQLTMNFGMEKIKSVRNVFAIPRPNKEDVSRASESAAMHPIIEHYRNGERVSVHHVIEDLTAEWKEPRHFDPLAEYFQRELSTPPAPKMHSKSNRTPSTAAMAK
ncbi:MAG: NAD(P)-binding domain-containing protein [Planctomycetales bacterium]|nr:NAD(P)-binding domain-containing protein [Planctomycetales bacterium]